MSLKQPVSLFLVAVALFGSGAVLIVNPPQQQRLSSRGAQVDEVKTLEAMMEVKLPSTAPPGGLFLPIIMYHKTPADFEQQLQILQDRGYTTVSLSSLTGPLANYSFLPLKPVVLTFDDGFSDQMRAFTVLQKYRMKATFYIINGGPDSNWCIGASRRYDDPSQPASGCGDSYLNWDQLRELDHSGLVTIGGHTIDHVDLAQLGREDQRRQIADSKLGIEHELGHPISDFAYPYGSYNADAITAVAQAGYTTAVTTSPGLFQDPGRPFTLSRIRDVQSLP